MIVLVSRDHSTFFINVAELKGLISSRYQSSGRMRIAATTFEGSDRTALNKGHDRKNPMQAYTLFQGDRKLFTPFIRFLVSAQPIVESKLSPKPSGSAIFDNVHCSFYTQAPFPPSKFPTQSKTLPLAPYHSHIHPTQKPARPAVETGKSTMKSIEINRFDHSCRLLRNPT
jgi:hypothetical protein